MRSFKVGYFFYYIGYIFLSSSLGFANTSENKCIELFTAETSQIGKIIYESRLQSLEYLSRQSYYSLLEIDPRSADAEAILNAYQTKSAYLKAKPTEKDPQRFFQAEVLDIYIDTSIRLLYFDAFVTLFDSAQRRAYDQMLLEPEDSVHKITLKRRAENVNRHLSGLMGLQTREVKEGLQRIDELSRQQRWEIEVGLARIDELIRKQRWEIEVGLSRIDELGRQQRQETREGLARIDELIRHQRREIKAGLARIDELAKRQASEVTLGLARIDERARQQRQETRAGLARIDERARQQRRETQAGLARIDERGRQQREATRVGLARIDERGRQQREATRVGLARIDERARQQREATRAGLARIDERGLQQRQVIADSNRRIDDWSKEYNRKYREEHGWFKWAIMTASFWFGLEKTK